MNELTTVQVGPAKSRTTVVWLHGLGANGHDFEPIVPHLDLPQTRFVFPNAPSIPVTINSGYVMPAWYDIRALGAGDPDVEREDPHGIARSSAQVSALLDVEREKGPERMVLMGFSQGGAMALHLGRRYPHKLAGIGVLSAYLVMEASVDEGIEEVNAHTPMLFCHGREDTVVPMGKGRAAYEHVVATHPDVHWHDFGMGHQVNFPELQVIKAWLHRVLQ